MGYPLCPTPHVAVPAQRQAHCLGPPTPVTTNEGGNTRDEFSVAMR